MSRRKQTGGNNSLLSLYVATWWSWCGRTCYSWSPPIQLVHLRSLWILALSSLLRTCRIGALFTCLLHKMTSSTDRQFCDRNTQDVYSERWRHARKGQEAQGERRRKRQISCKCVDRSATNGETQEGERRNRKANGQEGGGKVTRFTPPSARTTSTIEREKIRNEKVDRIECWLWMRRLEYRKKSLTSRTTPPDLLE